MILEIIQFRHLYLHPSSHKDVATTSRNVTIGRHSGAATYLRWKRQTTLQKWHRYNVSLWRLFMRRWNDVVLLTSSDVSIATIWQCQSDVGWRYRSDFETTSVCLLGGSNWNVDVNENWISQKLQIQKHLWSVML